MIYWGPGMPGENGGAPYVYTSKDNGKSWDGPKYASGLDHYNPPNTTIHAKDDINLIYQSGVGLVDLQLFWEKNALIPGDGAYCDNGGCDKRRVSILNLLSALNSLVYQICHTHNIYIL